MRLRLDERERVLKLTHPRSIRPAAALAWAASQKPWVDAQLEQALPPVPLLAGAIIPVDGTDVELAWIESSRRTPDFDGAKLVCGGPEEGFARRIEQFLRKLALETLSEETADYAGRAGVCPTSVRVGDAKSRWGSCSSKGAIRYSWRLILAPAQARRYVVAHEVAHLKHLDHSRQFKALERELFGGDTAGAEKLLREFGPRIRRIAVSR